MSLILSPILRFAFSPFHLFLSAIQDIQAGTKYPLENLGSAPANSIQTFVDEFVSGKLSPSIKSEPIPKDQDGPVHVLVADEFDKVVFDESKDLLVEFYAPWCGHCKKLAPTYDSLGEKYKEHKDKITIAKMDATTNDVPPSAGFSVQSFPTIKFRKAGSKEFMDFNGDRTLEGFVDFIGLNAVNKVPVNLEAVNETVEEVKEAPKKAAHEEVSVTKMLDSRKGDLGKEKRSRSPLGNWPLSLFFVLSNSLSPFSFLQL